MDILCSVGVGGWIAGGWVVGGREAGVKAGVTADANIESKSGRPVLVALVGSGDVAPNSLPPNAAKRVSTDIFEVALDICGLEEEEPDPEGIGSSLAKSLSSSEVFPLVCGWEVLGRVARLPGREWE